MGHQIDKAIIQFIIAVALGLGQASCSQQVEMADGGQTKQAITKKSDDITRDEYEVDEDLPNSQITLPVKRNPPPVMESPIVIEAPHMMESPIMIEAPLMMESPPMMGAPTIESTLPSEEVQEDVEPVNHTPLLRGGKVRLSRHMSVIYEPVAYDLDHNPLQFTIVDGPTLGKIAEFQADTGIFTYVHTSSEVGLDGITIKASDGVNETEEVIIQIEVFNNPPGGPVTRLEMLKNQATTSKLMGEDLDQDALSYQLAREPSHGTLDYDSASGEFTYTPDQGYSGADSFSYLVDDGIAISDSIEVMVDIKNQAPVIVTDPTVTHSIQVLQEAMTLPVTIRDMRQSHPDFEVTYLSTKQVFEGMVEDELDAEGKPVFKGQNGYGAVSSPETFAQWFRDTSGVNQALQKTITLNRVADTDVFRFSDRTFFPIDGEGYGNEGNDHNFHFTLEIENNFTYRGGETFEFMGDDDVWVFINGKLAVDLGGVHGSFSKRIQLDELASQLGITVGQDYSFKMFFVERKKNNSRFTVETAIRFMEDAPYEYQVNAEDADGDTLRYRLLDFPAGMMIDEATGLISWKPQAAQLGTHEVKVEVSDGDGGVQIQTFNLELTAKPTIS